MRELETDIRFAQSAILSSVIPLKLVLLSESKRFSIYSNKLQTYIYIHSYATKLVLFIYLLTYSANMKISKIMCE